ncbi:hypothetical protein HPB51_010763 [Rhipicephalus microplus]|uniref:Uncharacterized protein n=1 Tax=Rhipicephalus microplus TaxID=6941 RepID=A0A9J6DU26_RHIMP|nr:hypothetical protein HPB51_010763 [Rhipicephalus microplus]
MLRLFNLNKRKCALRNRCAHVLYADLVERNASEQKKETGRRWWWLAEFRGTRQASPRGGRKWRSLLGTAAGGTPCRAPIRRTQPRHRLLLPRTAAAESRKREHGSVRISGNLIRMIKTIMIIRKIQTHVDDKIHGQRLVLKFAFIIHRPTTVTVLYGTQARVTAAVTTITAGPAVFALEALLGLLDHSFLTSAGLLRGEDVLPAKTDSVFLEGLAATGSDGRRRRGASAAHAPLRRSSGLASQLGMEARRLPPRLTPNPTRQRGLEACVGLRTVNFSLSSDERVHNDLRYARAVQRQWRLFERATEYGRARTRRANQQATAAMVVLVASFVGAVPTSCRPLSVDFQMTYSSR